MVTLKNNEPKYAHAASISTETMKPPLANVSDCERSVIWFLHVRSETAVEINQILAAYGEECRMSKSMVCRFFAGERFDATEEIKEVVVEYFQNLNAEYGRAGLQKLHKRYMKCLDLQWEYVEK